MYNKILLPTDGSKYANKAEEHALFLAEAVGAEIIVLSVVENNFAIGLPSDDTIFSINQMLKKEAKVNLKNFNNLKEKLGSNVNVTLKLDEGSPADAILKAVDEEDIDLVIIGSSGKSGFDRFIMGSVADKVVNAAKCSVLVVH